MARNTHPIRYRRNRPPNVNARFGRKVMDEMTGFWTYEGRCIRNQQGFLVDGRGDGYDLPYNLTDAPQGKRPR